MSGKQVFLILIGVLIIIKDPQIVTQLINGIVSLINSGPNG